MKNLVLKTFILLIISSSIISCKQKNKSINDLVSHFALNGFEGTKEAKLFQMIQAVDGCGLVGNDFSIEIYKFENPEKMPNFLEYKNGKFGMSIGRGDEEELKRVFLSF
jgi:hypothetical protein